ncbi:hypothetical protein BOTBODRAFT_164971 [Botryobasidium botryosum FD-172 SS1]|uniref:Phosducin domain-containing protein n=1 Tax=Botryobasidium botryosum (strain FD-172 SS1) TaxID=930990 RepID=A0A067M0P9_BOTB1|nr:hypothetical protein BOTBODRAFT_164971 [Botryobasidium botryosum FD-172 SS1]
MYADHLEELVLSGALFDTERPHSPARSHSPSGSAAGSDDELFGGDVPPREASPELPQLDSIGMGPGRTGVKGVIRDRNEAQQRDRAKKETEVREIESMMEKTSLAFGGMTAHEEAEARKREEATEGDEEDAREAYRKERWREIRANRANAGFGHLREIGVDGYLEAVENEEPHVNVVMHIYDPSEPRCAAMDSKLATLARSNKSTKFLRVRASSIGFASKPKPAYSRPGNDSDDDAEKGSANVVDKEMLPTVLIYRGGELMFTWVRIDHDVGIDGMEELLRRHHIIPPVRRLLDTDIDFDLSDDDS